jgi:hypothetical protein
MGVFVGFKVIVIVGVMVTVKVAVGVDNITGSVFVGCSVVGEGEAIGVC